MLCTATRHPTVAVLDDPAARGLEPSGDHVRRRVALETRIRHDPDRRRRLDRHQRRHLGAREERDAVVVEELSVEIRLPLGPELPDHGEPLLEERAAADVVEAERLELPTDAVLGVPHPGAEDRPTARDHVQGGPLEREVQRVPGRGDHARSAQAHARGALRDRRQKRDRLVTRLREQRVPDPDRVEAGLLDDLRQVEQHRHVVVGRDQRLAVVQVDAELDHEPPVSAAASAFSPRCGTRMCSDIRCAARSASPRLAARRIAACSATERCRFPRSCSDRLR